MSAAKVASCRDTLGVAIPFRYRDATGPEVQELTRLVGDTLVWERDGVTLRLEGAASLDQALVVAESMD